MSGEEEVKKLAELARIRIPEDRIPLLAKEIQGVLAYMKSFDEVAFDGDKKTRARVRDEKVVLREDVVVASGDEQTALLREQFPEQEGRYLRVQKILSHE